MKAQYVIVEQVLIFMLGLFIAVGLAAAFGDFGDAIEEEFTAQQLDAVGSVVAGHVTAVYQPGVDEVEVVFPLPDTITGRGYTVLLEDRGVTVNASGKTQATGVKNIGNGTVLGMEEGRVLTSNVGQGKLTYNGSHIFLAGFT